jgi:protein subunit release factor A
MPESLEEKIIDDIINYAKSIKDSIADKKTALTAAEQTKDEKLIEAAERELEEIKQQRSNFIFYMLILLLSSPQNNKLSGAMLSELGDTFISELN